jgi:predicted metalloprotease
MRLDDERESLNVEDRRGMGFGGPVLIGGGGLGLLGIIAALLFGVDPSQLLQGGGEAPQQSAPAGPRPDDAEASFAKRVLATTEDVWTQEFSSRGQSYTPPTLVLYDELTPTPCGTGQSAMGPFYCPLDARVYLDLAFFRELKTRFAAPGDFAAAYVIAHEVGHHVQNLRGEMERTGGPQRGAGGLSVRTELQADCYAGVWANRSSNRLDPGDIQEALTAASAVGDDTLQKRTQGRVIPDAFTHGSSAQRVRWFTKGYQSGRPDDCDTFGASAL